MQLAYAALALSTLTLVSFGLVMVFSATSVRSALASGDEFGFLRRQGMYVAIGLLLLWLLARIPYDRLRHLAGPLLLGSFGLLIAVLLVAEPVNGARRWFGFGSFGVQPSELAKLALVLWLALYLSRRPAPRTLGQLMKPIGWVVLAMMALIFIEPDLGTTLSVFAILVALLLVSGTPLRLLGLITGVGAGLVFSAIWLVPYRRERFFSFLDPWADPEGVGFQSVQALVAVGSGGWFGRGIGESVQKVHYLPEATTDMIFAVVAEELGLVGTLATIGLYAVFGWAGFTIALRCRDPFGKRLAVGFIALVLSQATLNLSAVLGLAPLTGVPLPFISFGGSHLITSLVAVGVVLNIARRDAREAASSVPDRGRRDGRSRAARSGRGGVAQPPRRARAVRGVA
jgi:cell division protein FtsW